MKTLSLKSLSLEQLPLKMRTFQALTTQGVKTGADLLESDPSPIARRANAWSDLKQALERFKARVPAEEVALIENFLATGEQAAERQAEKAREHQAPELSEPLNSVYEYLRGIVHPAATRSLIRRFKLDPELVKQLESPPFVRYPFGLHRWVGLERWQLEGYRKAARSAWNVLPVHLRRMHAKEQQLPVLAWQAIYEIAQERNDPDLFLAAHEALGQQDSDQVIAIPQAETVPTAPPLTVDNEEETSEPLSIEPPEEPELQEAPEPPREPKLSPVEPQESPQEAPEILETQVAEIATKPYETPPRKSAFAQLPAALQEALKNNQPEIFHGVDHSDFEGAVAAILKRAEGLPRPFSLAELRPSIGDYSWLKKWAHKLTYVQVEEWANSTYAFKNVNGEHWSAQECLGALLLFFCCEEGRREAREGEIWPVIPAGFVSATRGELFAGEQPRVLTRQTIEAGARRLKVRHAFGTDGSHAWYQSIYLQFGLTRNGLDSLSVWLNQMVHASTAVERLYKESLNFQSTWDQLKEYRKGDLSTDLAKKAVSDCPFFLTTWTSVVLEAARFFSDTAPELTADGELSPVISTVHWSGTGKPSVHLVWRNLDSMEILSSQFKVFCEDERIARIARKEEGYASVPPELEVPLSTPYLTLELEGDEEDEEHFIDLVLWNTDEDFHLFDGTTGKRLPTDQPLSSRNPLLVLTAPGVEIDPPCPQSQMLERGERLHRVAPGWSEVTLTSQGEPVAQLTTTAAPDWISHCELVCSSTKVLGFHDTASVYVANLPADAEVLSARAYGKPVKFVKKTLTWDADIRIEPVLATPSLGVRLTVQRQGKKYTFQRSADLSLHDVSIQKRAEEPWRAFRDLGALTSFELKQAKVRFFMHPSHDHYGLMADSTFLGRPPRRLSSLQLPGGYGESLALWDGPYYREKQPLSLCQSYIDHGLLLDVSLQRSGRFEVAFHRAIEPTPDHFLLFLGESGEYSIVPSDQIEARGTAWKGYLPNFGTQTTVALGFRQSSLGTVMTQGYQPYWDEGDPGQTAELLRWMAWPIADRRLSSAVRAFVATHPVDCLLAWVFSREVSGVSRTLTLPETEEWLGAVRGVFEGVDLDGQAGENLWQSLQERFTDQTGSGLYFKLLSALPLPALRLIREVLTGEQKQNFIVGVCRQPDGPVFVKHFQKLREAAAEHMGANVSFVDALVEVLRQKRTDPRLDNLRVAANLPAFVQYAAVSLLHKERVGRPV